MPDKIDFTIINATYDAIAPLIKANGQDKKSVSRFVYYLLIVAAAIADQVDIEAAHFKALAVSAFNIGKVTDKNKSGPSN